MQKLFCKAGKKIIKQTACKHAFKHNQVKREYGTVCSESNFVVFLLIFEEYWVLIIYNSFYWF